MKLVYLLLLGLVSQADALKLVKDKKPAHAENLQISGKSDKSLVVQIEAVKKPEGSSKLQELTAMEEALKKATEEAHKQKVELESKQGLAQSGTTTQAQSQAMTELKKKQEAQQKELLDKLEAEEK